MGIEVTKSVLADFKSVIKLYKDKTSFPKENNWKKLDGNDLWLRSVGQVNMVGGVEGNKRFFQKPELVEMVSLERLDAVEDDDELAYIINAALREGGVRYASKDLRKCIKTKAILHNYMFISKYDGGFPGLLADLSNQQTEVERVHFLIRHMKYFKNKSARDFLMELGLNRNTIVIDVRVGNIFKRFGLVLPDETKLCKREIYDNIEAQLIAGICKPLNIEPVVFDRILFQHYNAIIQS